MIHERIHVHSILAKLVIEEETQTQYIAPRQYKHVSTGHLSALPWELGQYIHTSCMHHRSVHCSHVFLRAQLTTGKNVSLLK